MELIETVRTTLAIGPKKFIRLFLGQEGTPQYRRRSRIFRIAISDFFDKKQLRRELKGLVGYKRPGSTRKHSFFGRYELEKSMEGLDLKQMYGDILLKAPNFHALLTTLLPNSRSGTQQYKDKFKDKRNVIRKRITTITIIFVHSIAVNRAG